MTDQNKNQHDDPPVIGGISVPEELFAATGDQVPTDSLGSELYWLQKLNPGVIKFRRSEISDMDDATKRAMIDSFQYALGNKPLEDCIK